MNETVLTMGIDIGSTTSKCIILKNGSEIIAQAVIPVGAGTSGPSRSIIAALEEASMSISEIQIIAATGYGRNSIKSADLTVTELSCHAKGASWLCPGVRTVIDIGGQDCKALSLSAGGDLENFVMNDKCAAGTGRFLEVMAKILELDVSDLGSLDEKAVNRVEISSTCTVFAESEVISQLAQGVDICDLVAGIHRSVAVRAASLVKRLRTKEPVFMTGGVANNKGVVRAIEKELNVRVMTNPQAQLAGAIGAAIFAFEHSLKRSD